MFGNCFVRSVQHSCISLWLKKGGQRCHRKIPYKRVTQPELNRTPTARFQKNIYNKQFPAFVGVLHQQTDLGHVVRNKVPFTRSFFIENEAQYFISCLQKAAFPTPHSHHHPSFFAAEEQPFCLAYLLLWPLWRRFNIYGHFPVAPKTNYL